MIKGRVIKDTITIEFSCPEEKKQFGKDIKHSICLTDYIRGVGNYCDDWDYNYIEFKCPFCGFYHRMKI